MSFRGSMARFFFALSNTPLSGRLAVYPFTYLLEDVLGHFQVLTITTKAAISTREQVFVWTEAFSSFG